MPPNYNDINAATVETKYPFLSEKGTHIVVIQDWTGRETRKNGFGDFCNLLVVKTLAGDNSAEGAQRSRLRIWNRDGTLSELKQRAQVALTSAGRAKAPTFEFPVANVTGDVFKNIHDSAGRNVAGYPIKIQVDQIEMKTKAGQFTAITYSVPTARDLDGINLDEHGRVVA